MYAYPGRKEQARAARPARRGQVNAPAASDPGGRLSATRLLALQRTAGNAAVARLVGSNPRPPVVQREWALDEMAMVSAMTYFPDLNTCSTRASRTCWSSTSTIQGLYDESPYAVFHITDDKKRTALLTLLEDAVPIGSRQRYKHSSTGENVTYVSISLVETPTFRLGNIYDDAKLANVLDGMRKDIPLPPVVLDAPSEEKKEGGYRYRVRDGIHRYYAMVKLGYATVPAIIHSS